MRARSVLILVLAAAGPIMGLATGCGESARELISPPVDFAQLLVSWTIQRESGETVTCSSAQIQQVVVSVGGMPVTVPCDDQGEQQVVFTELPVGRYPVVIRLLGIGDNNVLREHLDNVTLDVGASSYNHDFILDQTTNNTRGILDVRWVLAGEPPEIACATYGADRVLVESQPGSIAMLQADLSCVGGRAEILDVLRGDYAIRFTLIDSDRLPIPSGLVQRNFRIVAGERTEDLFSFPLEPPPRSTVRLDWTVNGMDAADECVSVGAETISMEVFQQQSETEEISIRTSTAACDAGSLVEPDFNASADPDRLRFRVSAQLRGFAGLVITSTTIPNVKLIRGRTSTVTVDWVTAP